MSCVLQSEDLTFQYGGREVFNGVSFAVDSGDLVALLGANGAGKTTLLKLVAGLLRPHTGRVLINNRCASNWQHRELARLIALVPQELHVPFSFRVEEIVSQGRVPYLGRFGSMSAHDRKIVDEAMDAVDALELRDRVFSELSGGERQRIKIAIALAQQPRVMLLDEPTQHLDIGRQNEILDLLKQLNQSGITIIAAIHDLGAVRDNFERALLLLDKTCVSGEISDVMRSELLQRAFAVDAAAVQSYCNENATSAGFLDEKSECHHSRAERPLRIGRGSPTHRF